MKTERQRKAGTALNHMTAEQIQMTNEYVNMIFSELMMYFPAWRQSAVGMSPDDYSYQYKKELRDALVIAGIHDGEIIDNGLSKVAKKAEAGQSFLPPVVEFIKLCKGSTVPYHQAFKELDHSTRSLEQFSGGISEEQKQAYYSTWRTITAEGAELKEREFTLRKKYRKNRNMQFSNKTRVNVVDLEKGLVREAATGKVVIA